MIEKQNPRRAEYEMLVSQLCAKAAEMKGAGADAESIARALHAQRRSLAAHYKKLTPEPLRSKIHQRTLAVYRDPLGPTIEFLLSKGKSWDQIIDSATRPGVLNSEIDDTKVPVGESASSAPQLD
jgi:hypothetical protein